MFDESRFGLVVKAPDQKPMSSSLILGKKPSWMIFGQSISFQSVISGLGNKPIGQSLSAPMDLVDPKKKTLNMQEKIGKK